MTNWKSFAGLALELQSQTSHDVCDRMHAREDDDMFQYGKTGIAWEHWLNPARPAFHKTSDERNHGRLKIQKPPKPEKPQEPEK